MFCPSAVGLTAYYAPGVNPSRPISDTPWQYLIIFQHQSLCVQQNPLSFVSFSFVITTTKPLLSLILSFPHHSSIDWDLKRCSLWLFLSLVSSCFFSFALLVLLGLSRFSLPGFFPCIALSGASFVWFWRSRGLVSATSMAAVLLFLLLAISTVSSADDGELHFASHSLLSKCLYFLFFVSVPFGLLGIQYFTGILSSLRYWLYCFDICDVRYIMSLPCASIFCMFLFFLSYILVNPS